MSLGAWTSDGYPLARIVGEAVASGVYMYELRAGNHREMRRMIVRK